MGVLFYYNKESKMPVTLNESQVTEGNVRHDLIQISEEQYTEIVLGVINGKQYYDNGTHVFELPEANRAPKWFERIEYAIKSNVPTPTITKQPLSYIVELVSNYRKSLLEKSTYSERELNAFREMVESGLSNHVYIDRTGVATEYTLVQAMDKLKEITALRQKQFVIGNKYVRAYELGYDIPNPTVTGNWNEAVIDAITNKPVKISKKGRK